MTHVMRESPSQVSPRWLQPDAIAVSAVICWVVAMFMVINTHVASDGGWYWYARLWLDGRMLYADLEMNFQPLFPMLTAAWMSIAGDSWMAEKIPALIFSALLLVPIVAVVSQYEGFSPRQKALMVWAVFFSTIYFVWYRFDDYHIVANLPYFFSALIYLRLVRQPPGPGGLAAASLGLLAGICCMTRLNDGLFLLTADLAVLACLNPSWPLRIRSWAAAMGAALAFALLLIGLSGDVLAAYWRHVFVAASAIKGGGESGLLGLALKPFQLFFDGGRMLGGTENLKSLCFAVALCLAVAAYLAPQSSVNVGDPAASTRKSLTIAVIFGALFAVAPYLDDYKILVMFTGIAVLVVYSLALTTLAGLIGDPQSTAAIGGHRDALLVLLPLALFAAHSMSSGGRVGGVSVPLGLTMLVIPFLVVFSARMRVAYVAGACLLGMSSMLGKIVEPAQWHGFHVAPMFIDRQLVRHERHGSMIMEDRLVEFANRTCGTIRERGGKELLSIPFPYFNYYCDIVPWRGYVQTFFDTSSSITISRLMADLERSPPEFIMWQEQGLNLRNHEDMFNSKAPLPHRALHQYIGDQIASGRWEAIDVTEYGFRYRWHLIRTRPERSS